MPSCSATRRSHVALFVDKEHMAKLLKCSPSDLPKDRGEEHLMCWEICANIADAVEANDVECVLRMVFACSEWFNG